MKKVESHLKRDIGLAKKETLKRFAEAKKKLVMAEKHAEEYVEKNPNAHHSRSTAGLHENIYSLVPPEVHYTPCSELDSSATN